MLVERDTPGVEYRVIDKIGHRTCQNVTMTFRDVRVPAENLLARGDGDLVDQPQLHLVRADRRASPPSVWPARPTSSR